MMSKNILRQVFFVGLLSGAVLLIFYVHTDYKTHFSDHFILDKLRKLERLKNKFLEDLSNNKSYIQNLLLHRGKEPATEIKANALTEIAPTTHQSEMISEKLTKLFYPTYSTGKKSVMSPKSIIPTLSTENESDLNIKSNQSTFSNKKEIEPLSKTLSSIYSKENVLELIEKLVKSYSLNEKESKLLIKLAMLSSTEKEVKLLTQLLNPTSPTHKESSLMITLAKSIFPSPTKEESNLLELFTKDTLSTVMLGQRLPLHQAPDTGVKLCTEDLKKINTSEIGSDTALPESCRDLARKPKKRMKKFCDKSDQRTIGPLYVNTAPVSLDNLYRDELNFMEMGGRWSPENCSSKIKTAVIIPFRKREEHLGILLRQLLPMLKRQVITFQIFIIEQADNYEFNRGKLLNVGFAEALFEDNFNCFVFQDVDLIPEDDRIDYGCHASPQHLSVAVDKFNYKLLYDALFGGVEMFTRSHFETINGFSNSFWGWGGEDDNLFFRLQKSRMTLWRQSPQVAKYTMLKHESNEEKASDKRFTILSQSKEYIGTDGLNTLKYHVLEKNKFYLYTLVKVDLKKTEDKKFGALEKYQS